MADRRIEYLQREIARSRDPKRKAAFQQKLQGYRAQQGGAEGETPTPDATQRTVEETERILNAGADWAANRTAADLAGLNFGRVNAATTPEMQAMLDDSRGYAQQLRNLSPLELEALDIMRNSLAGYGSPEMMAMRDQALSGIQGDAATALRAAQGIAARGGVRGAAGAAQQMGVLRGQQQAVGNMERDLMIENARETQRRKEAFTNLVTGTEAARNQRGIAGQTMYGGMLAGEEQARTGREVYNNAQAANEFLTRTGYQTAAQGLYGGTYAGQQTADYNQRMLEFQQRMADQANQLSNKYLSTLTGRSTGGSAAV